MFKTFLLDLKILKLVILQNFCATKSNFCSQYEVERKKQKLLFDQNDNHRAAIVTQKENDALELVSDLFKSQFLRFIL